MVYMESLVRKAKKAETLKLISAGCAASSIRHPNVRGPAYLDEICASLSMAAAQGPGGSAVQQSVSRALHNGLYIQ